MDRLPVSSKHKGISAVCLSAWFWATYAEGTPAFMVPALYPILGLTPVSAAGIFSAFGLGLLAGSVVLSYLSDQIGRRAIFQIDLLLFSIFTGAMLFATDYWQVVVCVFFAQCGFGGTMTTDNAYISECFPPSKRGYYQTLLGLTFPPALALVPIVYLIGLNYVPSLGWKLMPLLALISAVTIFWLRRVLPESVRFLISRGKIDQANKIVAQFEASAGPQYKYDGPVVAPRLEVKRKAAARPSLFANRTYAKYTIVFCLGWIGQFTVTTTTNLLPTVFTSGLGGMATGIYLTIIVTIVVQIANAVSRLFTTLTVDSLGRRFNMLFGMILGAIGCIAIVYPWANRTTVPLWELAVPAMLATFSNSWFTAFMVSATELYPVEARSMAYGLPSACGRVASILAPFWLLAVASTMSLYFYPVATVLLVVAILTYFWIPETKKSLIDVSSKDSLLLGTNP
jgi:putative MFS transporter